MVSLKKLKISKIQKRLKMDFLKNPFLLVIGILLIIIIILIIYNYFNKKSKNIERFYFEDNFKANPDNCAKIGYSSTEDEKTKCCENNLGDINDAYKSLCIGIDANKYCTADNLQKYPSFKDDCLANEISLPASGTASGTPQQPTPPTAAPPPTPPPTPPPAAPVVLQGHSVCFAADSPVKLKNGNICRIDQIQAGMELANGKVIYIVKSICRESLWKYSISESEYVVGTKKHPVEVNGEWGFLKDCPDAIKLDLTSDEGEYVYGLCIEDSISFEIRGIKVAAYGHQIDDSQIATYGELASTFWGITIKNILKKLDAEGFLENGVLTLSLNDYIIKDKNKSVGLFYKGIKYE